MKKRLQNTLNIKRTEQNRNGSKYFNAGDGI